MKINEKFADKVSIKVSILTVIISIIFFTGYASASLDNEYASCDRLWYCTAYSDNTCGNRECIDLNFCSNGYMPKEHLQCLGGVGVVTEIPKGYFYVNAGLIKSNMYQDEVTQKIITINGTSLQEYILDIEYPSSYAKGTEFVTTSVKTKTIENGEFSIIIDSRGIIPGTYVIPLKVYNEFYSREIVLVVDVASINGPKGKSSIDSTTFILDANNNLNVKTSIDERLKNVGKISYEIIDSHGNITYTTDKDITNPSKIINALPLSEISEEGYYTLVVKISTSKEIYIESEQFVVLPQDKYSEVFEEPKTSNSQIARILILVAILLAAIVVTILNFDKIHRRFERYLKTYKYNNKNNTYLERGSNMFNIFRFGKKAKSSSTNNKLDLLKKSYDNGFISRTEYEDAIRANNGSISTETHIDSTKDISKSVQKPAKETKEYVQTPEIKHKEVPKPITETEHAIEKIATNSEGVDIDKAIVETKNEPKGLSLLGKTEKISVEKIEEKIDMNKIEDKLAQIDAKYKIEQVVKEEPVRMPEKITLSPMSHIIKKDSILDKTTEYYSAFGLSNGQRLYSLKDLLNALPNMPEHIWHHHTKEGRNDFATWIGDIFEYNDVADELRKADSRDDAIKMLKKYE